MQNPEIIDKSDQAATLGEHKLRKESGSGIDGTGHRYSGPPPPNPDGKNLEPLEAEGDGWQEAEKDPKPEKVEPATMPPKDRFGER
jgi:hypothetical protein